jgi:hypothetical protein
MKVLVAAIHYPIASGRYIARALRRLGHEVHTIGGCTGNYIWGLEVDPRYVWEPTLPKTGWKPDLVITADSAYTTGVDYDCPHVVYGVDNHVRDYDLGRKFDHLFLAHRTGPTLPTVNKAGKPKRGITWLPCGYDPEWHINAMPWDSRPVHAAFVGMPYPKRQQYIQALVEARFSVNAGIGALMDDYTAVYNHAKVSLCLSFNGDVAQRIFESAAMGNVILSDRCTDFPLLGFRPGVHYLPIESPDHAVEQMTRVINYPEDGRRISQQAQEWVREHTWDNRVRVILEWLGGR